MCTIKTHKQRVSLRILHSGTGHPFTALGHAIGVHLDSYLNSFNHLHRCTKTVLDQIRRKVFPQNICFCKLDIDDFYMSGTAGDLSLYSAMDMPASRELRELIFQMLASQRVELPIDYQNKVESYTVNIGSGMGLHASGAISEKVFLELVEKPFAIKPSIQEEYGIMLYARYRDDILIIADRDKNYRWWMFGREIMRRAAPIYKVSLDEIKSNQIAYLDACIYKPKDFAIRRRLETRLYRKPTAQKILLHPSSCHVESVHRSWPAAEVLRIGSLSSSYAQFLADRREFVKKLDEGFFPKAFTSQIGKIDPFLTQRKPSRAPLDCCWLVIPYHPGLMLGRLTKSLAELHQRWSTLIRLPIPEVRISWSSSHKNLLQICKSYIFKSGGGSGR